MKPMTLILTKPMIPSQTKPTTLTQTKPTTLTQNQIIWSDHKLHVIYAKEYIPNCLLFIIHTLLDYCKSYSVHRFNFPIFKMITNSGINHICILKDENGKEENAQDENAQR